MTITNLRYFLAAAQYLNFSRAADALYIHHTTMSRCITSMEEEIGAPLFIRMKYSLQLTELGAKLRVEADNIIESYDRMLREAQNAAGNITGHLSLLTPQLYYQMLADAYRSFLASDPQVEFAVDVCPFSKMDSICQAVIDGEVDMGITFSQNNHDDEHTLESLKIYEEEQLLTVPIDHPLAGRKCCRLSDLRDTTFLLADHQGKEHLLDILAHIDAQSNRIRIMHSSSGEALLLQFTGGLGATMMPGIIAYNSGQNFSRLKIEDVDTHTDVLLVWRKNDTSTALQRFLEQVRKNPPRLHPVVSAPVNENK